MEAVTVTKPFSVSLANGGKKENRREHDFYPTPSDCTIALMEFLKERNIKINSAYEPACGEGAISKVLSKYVSEVYSTDLFDYNYGIVGVNYLSNELPFTVDAIITNPPFNLSVEFITKAVKEAPIVAMLLKSQYWHSKSRYETFMKHPPAYVLPLTWRPNFAPDKGKAPTMETHWTVWIKGDSVTKYIPLKKRNETKSK